jgi:hypothetical protein
VGFRNIHQCAADTFRQLQWNITMKLIQRAQPVAFATILLAAATGSAAAWNVGPPQSSDGLARGLAFEAAVVWNIGYSAQLIVGCSSPDSNLVMLVFPRVEPFYLREPQVGHITIWDGEAVLWTGETAPVQSFTGNEVALNANASRGVDDLLRKMADPETKLSVSFSGIFSWEVHAYPPRSELDAKSVANLGEACSIDFETSAPKVDAAAPDLVEIPNVAEWFEKLSAQAKRDGLKVSRVTRTEVAIWPMERLLEWGQAFVATNGGTVLDRDSVAPGAALRLSAARAP